MIFAHKRLCAVLSVGGTKVPHECYHRHTWRIRQCYAAIFCMMIISFRYAYGISFLITKFKTESPTVIKNGKRKRPAPNRHGSKFKSAASQKNSGVVAAPTGVAETVQEEVCIVPAPPVCLLPVCSYARLTAYFGILSTRLPILPERDLTPSSSARGATLAVLASFVSRILPGQEYSIVTAIAARGTYCNAPPLIPQGQKRKMFLMAEKFLKLFFDTEKGGYCHPPFSISAHYISFL